MGFDSSKLFIILSITFLLQSLVYLPIVALKWDRLLPGDEVDSFDEDTYLVSANGVFTLGFFRIPSTNLTYLGIWLRDEPQGIKIWISNRDTPVIGHGIFTMSKVMNGSGAVFFTTHLSHQVGLSYNMTTVLNDWGCLFVTDVLDGRVQWQSSDHPTDTLLSSMTLGYDLRTNKSWTLTSWLSDEVPASGAFSLRFEAYQKSPQLVIYRRGKHYWASGPWNSTTRTFQFLSFVNGTRFIFPQHVNLTSDASGMWFSFFSIDDNSIIMLKLYPNGQFKEGKNQLSLTPEFCYGYESDNGCVVSPLPNCRVKTDSFQLTSGDWIGGSSITDDNSSISHADCTERCWNDCTCVGFNALNINGTGCIFWTSYATFRVDESDQAEKKYVLFSPKQPPKKKTWVWILVSLAIVFLFVLAYLRIKRRILQVKENRMRDEFIHQLTGSNSFNYGDELERGIQDAPDVKIFSLKAIMAATNNFSDENKLGKGGYGPVYKGKLSDGREIAVKRLSKTSGQGIQEFKSELILISKLQHTNLVRLYGCCIHQEEKMLIYEFMRNKSLDFFLFAQDEKDKIGWQIRFNIIEGVAQGLLYLHKYSRMKVIHRDLKVGNVLLDDNMNPKIADFGMARIFEVNVNEVVTNRVVGTFGYMAPEYIMKGTFSIKSDVFSFGVLILEIVSGRRNSSFYNPDRPLNLVGYAWELWSGHASLELKDEKLGESYDMKQLLRVIHLGLLCVQEKAEDRPTMSDAIYILNNENTVLPSPKQPAFFTGGQTTLHLNESNRPNQVSENNFTVTTMEAR